MRAQSQSKIDSMCPERVLILDSESKTSNKIKNKVFKVLKDINIPHFIVDIVELENEQEKRALESQIEENADNDQDVNEEELYLEENPLKDPEELILRDDVVNRIKSWIKNGIGKKEVKEELISSIARKGAINLEAPILNEEILVGIHPKSLVRDDYF